MADLDNIFDDVIASVTTKEQGLKERQRQILAEKGVKKIFEQIVENTKPSNNNQNENSKALQDRLTKIARNMFYKKHQQHLSNGLEDILFLSWESERYSYIGIDVLFRDDWDGGWYNIERTVLSSSVVLDKNQIAIYKNDQEAILKISTSEPEEIIARKIINFILTGKPD